MSTETAFNTAPAKGMRDLLPQETALRDWAIGRLVKTYEQFGFTRIETPAVENIVQLKRAEGGENLSLIFEILKRGEKLEKALVDNNGNVQALTKELSDLGLRFDLTVPLVRFFAHNQAQLAYPFKSIQVGSVWRAESPQAGRYRQFTQCDIDTFGIKSEIAEMELIQATSQALLDLGFNQFVVRVNDRRVLIALAKYCGFAEKDFDNLFIQIDKLDKIGLAGVGKELTAQGHNQDAIEKLNGFLSQITKVDENKKDKDHNEQDLSSLLPLNCDEQVVSGLLNVIKAIKDVADNRYTIVFDPSLVRGMGYYTGQIFEIAAPGYAHSIAGGGRYDKMVGKYTGRDVPACGFSIGFERIISILMEKGIKPNTEIEKIALIFDQDRDQLTQVLATANVLRNEGKHIAMLPRKKDMRKQIDNLLQEGYSGYAVYYPDKEKLEIKTLSSPGA